MDPAISVLSVVANCGSTLHHLDLSCHLLRRHGSDHHRDGARISLAGIRQYGERYHHGEDSPDVTARCRRGQVYGQGRLMGFYCCQAMSWSL